MQCVYLFLFNNKLFAGGIALNGGSVRAHSFQKVFPPIIQEFDVLFEKENIIVGCVKNIDEILKVACVRHALIRCLLNVRNSCEPFDSTFVLRVP